jgi:hypothetical protein
LRASSLNLLLGRQDPAGLRFEGCAHPPDFHDVLLELVTLRPVRDSDNPFKSGNRERRGLSIGCQIGELMDILTTRLSVEVSVIAISR